MIDRQGGTSKNSPFTEKKQKAPQMFFFILIFSIDLLWRKGKVSLELICIFFRIILIIYLVSLIIATSIDGEIKNISWEIYLKYIYAGWTEWGETEPEWLERQAQSHQSSVSRCFFFVQRVPKKFTFLHIPPHPHPASVVASGRGKIRPHRRFIRKYTPETSHGC